MNTPVVSPGPESSIALRTLDSRPLRVVWGRGPVLQPHNGPHLPLLSPSFICPHALHHNRRWGRSFMGHVRLQVLEHPTRTDVKNLCDLLSHVTGEKSRKQTGFHARFNEISVPFCVIVSALLPPSSSYVLSLDRFAPWTQNGCQHQRGQRASLGTFSRRGRGFPNLLKILTCILMGSHLH